MILSLCLGIEEIFNTGIANTLAGNDSITGNAKQYQRGYQRRLQQWHAEYDDGNDIITGIGSSRDLVGDPDPELVEAFTTQ
jgi:hypothetical protein